MKNNQQTLGHTATRFERFQWWFRVWVIEPWKPLSPVFIVFSLAIAMIVIADRIKP